MSGPKRRGAPKGGAQDNQFKLSSRFAEGGLRANRSTFSLGVEGPALKLDPELANWGLKLGINRRPDLKPLWELAVQHGRPVLTLPFQEPSGLGISSGGFGITNKPGRLVWEIEPLDAATVKSSDAVKKVADQLGIKPEQLVGTRLWLVYRNDGGLPFNPGSGSDQGPTAFLGLYVTFDEKSTGLTRLGWTVIDMRTPKGTLPPGTPFDSKSQYQSPSGPYSGISSIDFTVTLKRDGLVKVDFLGSAGIDSTKWGKFVQDFIHKKVSNSPLFPWPDKPIKPYVELGTAVLVTPQKVLTDGTALGISYEGKIEFGASVVVGTHKTEGTGDARLVIRTATVKSPVGNFTVEYSPIGAFVRGFARYDDRPEGTVLGIEGGVTSSAMIKIGRLGIGVQGEILVSTDPALKTDNPAGSRPLLNPLSQPIGSGVDSGGPAGHHGSGQLVLTWTF